jgi:hypothetical protein
MYTASRRRALGPTGVQERRRGDRRLRPGGDHPPDDGQDGLPWTPFSADAVTFILVGNLWEIIPVAQMPINARIAGRRFLTLVVYLL